MIWCSIRLVEAGDSEEKAIKAIERGEFIDTDFYSDCVIRRSRVLIKDEAVHALDYISRLSRELNKVAGKDNEHLIQAAEAFLYAMAK